ncbi:UV-endonuclease UvdE-domain-containing protein [Flammula alnicola]|nr:UV-endonuclease UvdE-domain-containing protein [Flammula alnicola]
MLRLLFKSISKPRDHLENPYFVGFSVMNDLVSRLDHATATLRRSARLFSVSTTEVRAVEKESTSQAVPIVPRQRKHVRLAVQGSEHQLAEDSKIPDKAVGLESPPSRQKTSLKRTRAIKGDDDGSEEFMDTHSKPKGKRKLQPDPVYAIEDVEMKETSFKGRLGYACLNTVLRNKKPATESIFCSRTCRLESCKKNGVEFAKDLGRRNVEDLLTVIQWNEDNNIRFFRLSSEMFPYASHGAYGYSLEYCASLLAKAGALANKYGHRLTTHPGQFTQLGSPKPTVVEAAIRELAYHCQMLDLMGMGPDSVMIIHGGGVYNDKPATLGRLKGSIRRLPNNVRQRLVLENDEICYNAEDLLPICEELDVPFVFDYHHDMLFPSSISPVTIIERANVIWARRGIKPKQHLSEPRPGAVTLMERRAHADRCEDLPQDLPDDMDLMIEAKDKEQAVLYLHRMYNLQPVVLGISCYILLAVHFC